MQIGIYWQPINHIPAAICWATLATCQQTYRTVDLLSDTQIYLCTTAIWDTLRTFNFHLLSSRGALSQESFVSGGAMKQLFSVFVQQEKFKILYVAYFKHVWWAAITSFMKLKYFSNVRFMEKNNRLYYFTLSGLIVELQMSMCCFRLKQVIYFYQLLPFLKYKLNAT